MKKTTILVLCLLLCLVMLISCASKKTEEEYNTLIKELSASKEYESLIDNYEQLIKFYPESEKIQEYKGNYLKVLLEVSEQGAEEEQMMYLEKILAEFGDQNLPEIDYVVFRLAQGYEGTDDQKSSELYGKIAMEDFGELARYLISEEKYDYALACYQKQIELFPDDPSQDKMVFMLGYIYSEYLKDYEKAKEQFKIVMDKYPDSELSDDAKWMFENVGKPLEEIVFKKDSEAENEGAEK